MVSADVLAIAAQQAADDFGDDWEKGANALPNPKTLNGVVTQLVDLPDLVLEPEHDQEAVHAGVPGALPASLAVQAAAVAASRRRHAGVRNYAEVLSDLRDVLVGPDGDALAAQVRGRLRVALIDEFQDTDRLHAAAPKPFAA